jgi:hypothetical protein
MYSEFYALVEGNDDERFIDKIIKPVVSDKYDYFGCYKYAQRPKKEIEKFVRSLVSRKINFICLTDIDSFPCISTRKQFIKEHKIGEIKDNKIIVVRAEIESWYLAGVKQDCSKRIRIRECKNTNNINKEQFCEILEKSKLGYSIDCMIEMLNHFDVDLAKTKNNSFNYFYTKCVK